MLFDSNLEVLKKNNFIKNSILKILENYSNSKLKFVIISTKEFLTKDFIKNIEEKIFNNSVDFYSNSSNFSNLNEYDIIIEYPFIDIEKFYERKKILMKFPLIENEINYFSFVSSDRLNELQILKYNCNNHIKICNFLNNNFFFDPNFLLPRKNFKKINETKNIEKLNEFEIYEKICSSLISKTKNDVINNSLERVYGVVKNDEKFMEKIIFDYIISNKNQIIFDCDKNYSLITGKEGYKSIRIKLDEEKLFYKKE